MKHVWKSTLVLVMVLLASCQLLLQVDPPGGTGGNGGTGGQGGAGGMPCNPAQCPAPSTKCLVAICSNGACATENATAGTDCTADGAAGKVCNGNGACVECLDAAMDCPAPPNECVVATCTAGACGTMNIAVDTPTVGGQIDGDCKLQVCDGNGSTKQNDDDDPTDDMNDCTTDTCSGGMNVHTNIAGSCNDNGGTVCGTLAGPKEGTCVECNNDNDCTAPLGCDPFGSNICVSLDYCFDMVKNGTETGFDCGGPDCGPCPNNQGCMSANDCQSGFCSGTTCAACTVDANCPNNQFCGTASVGVLGVCSYDLPDGGACSAASQCASGNCVDGFCCDTACGSTCQACSAGKKGSGVDGTCGNIVVSTDPDNECTGNNGNDVCDGNGACKAVNGTACSLGTQCVSGQCTDGFCCNNACSGTCQACSNAKTGGTNGVCGNVTVNTDPDNECAGGECNGAGACEAAGGAACTLGSQCISGFCVDGFCCNTACSGTCQACSAAKKGAGANGTCGNIASGTNPDNEGSQTSGDCQKIACNGAGALASFDDATDLPTSNTVCLINPACSGAPLAPSFSPAPTGTDCTSDGQAPKHLCGNTANPLIAGTCVECNTNADCLSINDAGTLVCNTSTGTCQ